MTEYKHFVTLTASRSYTRRLLGDRDELTIEIYEIHITPSWSSAETPVPAELLPSSLVSPTSESSLLTTIEWETDDFYSRDGDGGITVDYYVPPEEYPDEFIGKL